MKTPLLSFVFYGLLHLSTPSLASSGVVNSTALDLRMPYKFDYLISAFDYYDVTGDILFLHWSAGNDVITKYKVAGKTVFCLVNVGSWEYWTDDANLFPEELLGNDYEGWPGEKWFDIRNTRLLLPLIRERFRISAENGCDGIAADNIIGWQFDTGFEITRQDQLIYNRLIGGEIRTLELKAGLNNAAVQAAELTDYFDFAVALRCYELGECPLYQPFIDEGRPVFDVEYDDVPLHTEEWFNGTVCLLTNTTGISFILKSIKEAADFVVHC